MAKRQSRKLKPGMTRGSSNLPPSAKIDITKGTASEQRAYLRGIIEGLLEIAETAMPDTYFATDSRVKRAKSVLRQLW